MRGPFAPILNAVQVMGRPGAESRDTDEACVTLTRRSRAPAAGGRSRRSAEVEDARAFLGRTLLDLKAVIARAIEVVRPLLAARGHQIELRTGAGIGLVEGDWRCLNRVFVNLLTNAARYTGNGGHI